MLRDASAVEFLSRLGRCRSLTAAIGLLTLAGHGLGAQSETPGTLDERVIDNRGMPLSGAEVVIVRLDRIEHTDAEGRAILARLPGGNYVVRVRRLGYRPRESPLSIGGDTVFHLTRLEPLPAQLGAVEVREMATPQYQKQFELRRRMGIGRFLTTAQLDSVADRDLTYLLEVRFPGLRVVYDHQGQRHLASTRTSCGVAYGTAVTSGPPVPHLPGGRDPTNDARNAQGSCFLAKPCLLKVFLDDLDLGDIDVDIARTWDLAGVEYYTGASMPPQYRVSGSACGVLLLWSRRTG